MDGYVWWWKYINKLNGLIVWAHGVFLFLLKLISLKDCRVLKITTKQKYVHVPKIIYGDTFDKNME